MSKENPFHDPTTEPLTDNDALTQALNSSRAYKRASSHDQVPPSDLDKNSPEYLEQLRQWAHDKQYIQPGQDGSLAGGIKSLAWGGPMMQQGDTVDYVTARDRGSASIFSAPAEIGGGGEASSLSSEKKEKKKAGGLRRLLGRRNTEQELQGEIKKKKNDDLIHWNGSSRSKKEWAELNSRSNSRSNSMTGE